MTLGLVRAVHPSLHMDESLYLGASLHMLHGDPLLTTYWLDKIPFASILMIPGILTAGENSLGFHLSGLIAGVAGVLVAQSLVRNILGRSFSSALAQIFYLAINVAPFMIFHHASAFTDPFLLLFLLLFLRATWLCLESSDNRIKIAYEKKAYVYFTLGLLVKFAAIMWTPVLIGFWLLRYGPRWWQYGPRRLAYTGRYLWLGSILYMLANPGKLAPILWFSALWSKDPGTPQHNILRTFIDRMVGWIRLFTDVFGPNQIWAILFFMILAISSATLWRVVQAIRPSPPKSPSAWYEFIHKAPPHGSRFVLLFLLPFWAHAFGLCLSGASLFSRYLYILVPQLALAIVFGSRLLHQKAQAHSPGQTGRLLRMVAHAGVAVTAITALLILISSFDFERQWLYVTHTTTAPESGRELYKIRDELPRQSVIHHDSRLWFLHPFVISPGIRTACQDPSCLADAQIGRAPFDRQYSLIESPDHRLWEVRHLEPRSTDQGPFHFMPLTSQVLELPIKEFLTENRTRRTLRIFGWAQEVAWNLDTCHACDTSHMPTVPELPPWIAAQPLPEIPATLTVSIKSSGHPYLPTTLHMKGHWTLTRGVAANPYAGEERWVLAFRLEHVHLGRSNVDLVDVAPIIYGSYIVPFGPLDIQETHLGSFSTVTGLSLKNTPQAPLIVATIARDRKGS